MGPPHAIGIVTMTPSQAASFVIEYVASIKADSRRSFDAIGDARVPARTIWIPFSEHQTCTTGAVQGVLRLYVREDASYELFVYSADDDSRWAHGDDYLVVFHKV
jgi:hypothetical protein